MALPPHLQELDGILDCLVDEFFERAGEQTPKTATPTDHSAGAPLSHRNPLERPATSAKERSNGNHSREPAANRTPPLD
jgi:hypothetical protein